MIDGDIFQLIVPLDDNYSFDADSSKTQLKNNLKSNDCALNCTLTETEILEFLKEHPTATQKEIAAAVSKSLNTAKNATVHLI